MWQELVILALALGGGPTLSSSFSLHQHQSLIPQRTKSSFTSMGTPAMESSMGGFGCKAGVRPVVSSSRKALSAQSASVSAVSSNENENDDAGSKNSKQVKLNADSETGEKGTEESASESDFTDLPVDIIADQEINSNIQSTSPIVNFSEDLGSFNPDKKIPLKREVLVGDPQQKVLKEKYSVTAILKELAAIQQQGPQKYCILGTRHCSYLHQQIIELLSYALVLSENHVYTSGAMGTNAAAIRGALRAGRDDLLTVILPQSLSKQPNESQDLLKGVTDLVTMPQNDDMSLDVASRLCNSKLLSETDQLIAFAFHESTTVIEATKEAKKLEMLVTTLFLD